MHGLLYKMKELKLLKQENQILKVMHQQFLNEKFEIGCEDGSIEPLILQREGKT